MPRPGLAQGPFRDGVGAVPQLTILPLSSMFQEQAATDWPPLFPAVVASGELATGRVGMTTPRASLRRPPFPLPCLPAFAPRKGEDRHILAPSLSQILASGEDARPPSHQPIFSCRFPRGNPQKFRGTPGVERRREPRMLIRTLDGFVLREGGNKLPKMRHSKQNNWCTYIHKRIHTRPNQTWLARAALFKRRKHPLVMHTQPMESICCEWICGQQITIHTRR